jgi:DNA polymerase (family X)
MKNALVAGLLRELADYTEMEDDQPYRARAYRRAAQIIAEMQDAIETVAAEGKLEEIQGVGEAIAKKIKEIVNTGKLEALSKTKERIPVDVSSLTRVEGIGPKKVKLLYKQNGIKNLDDLEKAVKAGSLDLRLPGVKTSQQIIERIENARMQTRRVLLVQAEEIVGRVVEELEKIPGLTSYEVAGSFRRRKETVGDLDVLVEGDISDNSLQHFAKGAAVKEVLAVGETKASVKLENNFQVDVRVVPKESWGAALLYFTGSKAHNVELRTRALKMNLHLNEYGLFREDNTTLVAGSSEEEVYSALGLDYIPPELRENKSEIIAAENHTLPKLIELSDIKGDLQMHTTWSDGADSVKSMVENACKLGYEYIAITDHVGSLKIANALDTSRIDQQKKEIERMNYEYKESGINFHILRGAEVNIRSDGTLDMPDKALREFEVVLASIHGGFTDDRQAITRRFVTAMQNENVDIIAHPSGRLLLERAGYEFDLQKLVETAVATETVLEIDGYPNRLDLSDENAREAIKLGCTLSIDTDAHSSSELAFMHSGVYEARRGWVEREDVLNTRSFEDLVRFLGST